MSIQSHAASLEQLHRSATILRVVNVWDAITAKVVADVDGPVALLELPHTNGDAAADELLRSAMERGRVREFHEIVPQLADIYREVA